jgi:RimJ/RimL family protein N-acetyltransferase
MEFPQVSRTDETTLLDFLTAEEWPFHVAPKVDPGEVRDRLAAGAYDDAFWVIDDGARIGLVRLFDLDDGAPLFDLRVSSAARGRGAGTRAVRWLTEHVFTNHDAINRIEGTTRDDNHAMRRVFVKSGYVKECHYRESWPARDRLHDSVGYAILRRDWETGTTTPVNWADV